MCTQTYICMCGGHNDICEYIFSLTTESKRFVALWSFCFLIQSMKNHSDIEYNREKKSICIVPFAIRILCVFQFICLL